MAFDPPNYLICLFRMTFKQICVGQAPQFSHSELNDELAIQADTLLPGLLEEQFRLDPKYFNS